MNDTNIVNNTNDRAVRADNEELSARLASLGENLGSFKAYDSQLTIAEIANTRIIKCLYQASKDGKRRQENSYVRIPTNHLSEELIQLRIEELSPYILSWLQELEGKQIKDLHSKGLLRVDCTALSLDALIERLEESEQGTRLNKEKIEAWFTAELQESLSMLFADKIGFEGSEGSPEQLEKLALVLGAYKAKFASLASGKTFIKEQDCIAMIEVIHNCDAQDGLTPLSKRFIARLTKMTEKKDDLLMSL